MRIFAELSWLWKGLGISLLSSAVGVGLVWAVCRARKKPINKPAAVITGAAAFAASVIVLLLLSQTPKTIYKMYPTMRRRKTASLFCI